MGEDSIVFASSQWISGSVEQHVWDSLDSSHATGFQTDVRKKRTCLGVLGISAASFFVANQSENVFQVWSSESSGKKSVGHLGAAVQ